MNKLEHSGAGLQQPGHNGIVVTASAPSEAEQQERGFDHKEARRFLDALGKDRAQTWVRALDPLKQRKAGPDHQGLTTRADLRWLQDKSAAGFNLYAVISEAPAASGRGGGVTDADITVCPALFVEWDDGASIKEQSHRWFELGLPEPTVMVATGGKSVHCYWLLTEPMQPDQWRVLQKRLITHAKGDQQCKNPSRVMRLPGSIYYEKETGAATGQCRILATISDRYSAAEIEACLPPEQKRKPVPAAPRGEWEPRGIDEINAAAEYIPRRKGGEGTYEQDRNALCGCSAALAAAGAPDPDGAALALLGHLWPSEREAQQVLETAKTRKAASFWAIAQEHGYNLKRSKAPAAAAEAPATTTSASGVKALLEVIGSGWTQPSKNVPPSRRSLAVGDLSGRLTRKLGQRLGFNELLMRPTVGEVPLQDWEVTLLHAELSEAGWNISAEAATAGLLLAARRNSYHPVQRYLERIEADAAIIPFDLDQVGPRFFRAEQELHKQMIRKWLIGAVARAKDPGCQMDYCLVLQSHQQGLLKSSTLGELASPDWFCSTIPEQDKDLTLNVHSCWLFELAELETLTGRKAAGHLKNMLTTRTDLVRVPFGKSPERMKRGSVFCATVNKSEFLRDDTGNRRFWVVPIEGTEKLDRAGVAANRDAIWKAAVLAWRSGELPMLPDHLEALSAAQNEQFNEQDAWIGMVEAWMKGSPLHRWDPERDPSVARFDPDGAFSSAEILYSAGLKRADAITRADEMRLGVVLRSLEFTRDKNPTRTATGRVRCWRHNLAQPGTTGTTSAPEVVPPETDCATSDLPPLAQPAQPFSVFRGLRSSGASGGGGAEGQNRNNTPREVKKVVPGCATPENDCSAGDLPGTTSGVEVVPGCATPPRLCHPREADLARIRELRPGTGDLSDHSDEEVAGLRQSLEAAHKRQSEVLTNPRAA